MSIIHFPYNQPLPKEVPCVFCKRIISMSELTIGPLNAQGKVSLLCNGHLWDGLKFIDELADYVADERRKLLYANGDNLMQFGGTPDVHTLY
jgi:hypothetical protein